MDEIIQKVSVDLGDSAQTVGELRQQFDALTQSEAQAQAQGERFNFTNEELIAITGRYSSSLKAVQQQAQQTSSEIASGMQNASAIASASLTDLGKNASAAFSGIQKDIEKALREADSEIGQSSELAIGSVSQQRIAFTDLGRTIDGQGLSLRNLTSTLGLLGPEGFIAGAALAGIGYALYSLIDTSKAVSAALREVNDQFDKMKDMDKVISSSIDEQTKLLKSRAEATGATVDQITDIEEAGAKKQLQVAQETLDQLNQKQKQSVAAYLKDDSDKNKAIIDGLNANIALQQMAVQTLQDNIEIIQNKGTARDLEQQKQRASRQQTALQNEQAFIAKVNEITDDAEQKEADQLTQDYARRKADLIKNQLDTTALTEAYLQGLSDIRTKFALKEAQEISKLEADQAKKVADERTSQLTELQGIENSFTAKTQKDTESKQQNELTNLANSYARAKDLAMLNGADLEKITDEYNAAVAAIDAKYADEAVAAENKKDSEILQRGEKQANSIIGQQKSSYANQKTEIDSYQKQLDEFYIEGIISDNDYTDLTNKNAQARNTIRNKEIQNYASYAGDIGNSLKTIGEALGEQTQAGKDVAIAGTIIATLSSAVKAYDAMADIPVVGPALGIAAAAAALASGYENVKKIEETTIPGQGGGGSSTSSTTLGGGANGYTSGTSYSAPTIPQSSNVTTISPQSINQINQQQQSAPVRAYVVETDITNTQEQVAGYQSNSRI